MKRKVSRWFLGAALAALGLYLAGITWGLPNTFNADEPHLVNLAVSFGGGSLRPALFKYPTLWPYVLFFSYGIYFLAWSGLALRHGVSEFAGFFAWHPAGFYLIGRLLSACFGLMGALVVWRTEREFRSRTGIPWAALLLAFAPVIVELAHSCKPDNLMFFFASAAWYFALKIHREGSRRAHWACGAFLGLALSCQYTALPTALVLPLAHFFTRKKTSRRFLAEGLGAAALGFFAGSPYALLDFPRFWTGVKEIAQLSTLEAWDRKTVFRAVLANLGSFASAGSIAGLAALLGLMRLADKERDLALVLFGPILLYVAVLSNSPDGGWPRYLLGCYPALALLASEGLAWAEGGRPARTALLVLTALVPGICRSAIMDVEMMRPDTREIAEAWIQGHVPAGATLLADLPHTSPRLAMTKEEAQELWLKTSRAGSPRARLYRAMADAHPGGGYRILRLQRSPRDLHSYPHHVELSQAETLSLDASSGLGPARASGVDFVITSSYGATPERSPELGDFFKELYRQGELIKVFAPVSGTSVGPVLRVYHLEPPKLSKGDSKIFYTSRL